MIFPAEAELQLMTAEDSEDSTGDYGEAVTEAVTELGVEMEMETSPSPADPYIRPVHGRPLVQPMQRVKNATAPETDFVVWFEVNTCFKNVWFQNRFFDQS